MAGIQIHESLSEDSMKELQEASRGGIDRLKQHIQQKNEEWKKIPLNIGITGEAGVGKSSFINAIRGLSAEDEGSAHVDVVEGTRAITPYKHPTNENMILWDLPGVGTPNFPRSSYLNDVKFDLFDFFLIMSAGRFTEDSLWLANEICKRKKNFHFVRTKVNLDVNNDRESHPKTHSKSKVIEKVRADCLANLKKNGHSGASVFLIDNYAPREFDFNLLTITLIDEAPIHKKEAMILSLSVLTEGVLERKVEALRGRTYKVALLSALGGAIPIPGLSAVMDSAILLEEIAFYKTQLGLDRKTMEENAKIIHIAAREFEKKLGIQSSNLTTVKDLAQVFTLVAASETIETALPFAIPVIGSLISAGISYGVTLSCLRYSLKLCSDDARKINKELMNKALY